MNNKTLYTVFLICALIFSGATGFSSVEGRPTVNSQNIVPGQPGTVFHYEQTFGKNGVAYLADNSHLYHPVGVGLDGSGNLWVAESYGARVMKYTKDGAFLMSIGTAGLTFLADETHFVAPLDVTIDSDGNTWVVDGDSARVVEFDSTGSYLTQLGVTFERGSDNIHFDGPTGIAFDSAKNIYVTDFYNHRVQVFDSNGVYSTTIGVTGVSGADNNHFNSPLRLAIDEDYNLYVVDSSNHRVQIFDANHAYSATLGVTGVSDSDNIHFDSPRGIAVDSNYIYVADANNHRVQIFNRDTRTYQDTLGVTKVSGSDNLHFDTPRDVAVDSSGNLYVADAENQRVQKYNNMLVYMRTFGVTGVPYLTDGYHYNQPTDVAVDANGNIAVVEDYGRGERLIMLDASGVPQFTIGEAGVGGSDNDHFGEADAVAFDTSGNIYVADCSNHRIQIFTSGGVYSATLGSYGQGDYEFDCPRGVAFDSSGKLYVADATNQRIQIFDSSLTYIATIGETGVPGSDNDHFRWPQDVEVDGDGNIYIVDTDNQRVQKFDSSHAWKMTLGVTGECAADVSEDFEHFCTPMGIAVDGAGNVYVAAYWNPRVQVFNAEGAYLTTIGGAWGDLSSQFRQLRGVAVDAAGNVYVPDLFNHRIQKFAPGVPDWQQVNINGFGERFAKGITAVEEFNGQLYAGTSTSWEMGMGAQIYRTGDGVIWSAVTEPGFSVYTNTISTIIDLEVFNGQLYAGAGWGNIQGQIWRTSDGTTWEPVTTNGFGNGSNMAVTVLAVFNNLLYAGTGNSDSGAQIWRSASGDGGDWTRVAPDETGTSDNSQVTGLKAFKGALYAAVEADEETNAAAQVWRSTNGSGWDTVIADGFGDSDNISTGGFAEFGGYLYLGVRNYVSGAQLWRSADGTNWKQVVGNGFGDAANYKVEMLTVIANQLYAEVNNDETGLQILRSSDGMNWEQVNIDGFGDSNNAAILWNNSTAKYQGYLYLGTWNPANGGEVWKYYLQEKSIYLPMIKR
jgi:sugar lactone lactonase YvrE